MDYLLQIIDRYMGSMKIRFKNLSKFASEDSGIWEVVDIVKALVVLIVTGVIGIYIAQQTVTTAALPASNASASGTLTFTPQNVSDGEYVNLTYSGGVYSFQYNISNTGEAFPAGSIYVNLSVDSRDVTSAARNLTVAINNNVTLAAVLTASNATNQTIVTYDSGGTAGNSIGTTEAVANATWAASTLTGGTNVSQLSAMQANLLGAGQTGSGFIVILIIAFIGGMALAYLGGMFGSKKRH